MRLSTLLLVVLFLAACSTTGTTTPTTTISQVLAGAGCVTAILNAGLTVSGSLSVGGAVTATNVLNTLIGLGTNGVPAAVLTACQSTLALVGVDATGAVSLLTPSTHPAARVAIPVYSKAHPPRAGLQPSNPLTVVVR